MKLSEITKFVNGTLEGDSDKEINNVGKIEYAKPDEITFIANPVYEKFYNSTNAGAIIVSNNFQAPVDGKNVSLIYTDDPYIAFLKILEMFSPDKQLQPLGIHESAVISDSAVISKKEISIGVNCFIGDDCKIGDNVTLYPNCVIMPGTQIGNNVLIHPGVIIYDNCVLGNNIIIHSNTVIGSDGFGQAKNKDGTFTKIPQKGIVVLEDDVEIGSGCTIDRATLGETKIGKGVKLDNQIQIAHNVEIGDNTVIAAQTGIAGSTKIGKNCMIGGKVGIVGHIEICDDVILTAATNVSKSITEPGMYSGYRAQHMKAELKQEALKRNLQEINKRLSKIENTFRK
jgi:UDP-3-O-[3-hydroxymyristoyl] glucosamine N-acyltransferase